MIQYKHLKNWLLKAVNLTKIRSGLVLVKRPVNRQSGTNMEYRWIRPDQVQKTDYILAGHYNLQQGHPQRPAKVRSHENSEGIPKRIQQSTDKFYSSFGNDDDFYHALHNMAVTWKRDLDNPKTDLKRAKLALNNAQMNGLELDNFPVSLMGLDSFHKEAPAIKKKTSSSKTKSQGDPALIKIPKTASPSKRILGELINKMTDVDVINKCFILRAIPEDSIAQDYMLNTSLPELKEWMKSARGEPALSDVVEQFVSDMEIVGEPSDIILHRGVMDVLRKNLSVQGCKTSLITEGINKELQHYSMDVFTHPQKYIESPSSKDAHQSHILSPTDLLKDLGGAYMDYTDDLNHHGTNRGYSGDDPEIYKNRYNSDKEGFIRILQRIKQDNSSNSDIGAKVDKMVSDYNKMMSLAENSPRVLGWVLRTPYSSNSSKFEPREFGGGYYNTPLESIQITLNGAELQTNVVLKTLQDKGYRTSDIVASLGRNSNLSHYRIYNSQTGKEDTIDMQHEVDPVTGKTIAETTGSATNKTILLYALLKLQQQHNLTDSQMGNWYSKAEKEKLQNWLVIAKQKAAISKDTYQQIHDLSYKIFGYNIDHVPINGTSWKKTVVTPDFNDAKKVILSNLLMARAFNESASNIAMRLTENSNSKFNDQGKDYSGNFDFYDGAYMPGSSEFSSNFPRQHGSSSTYTAPELSSKITNQLNSVPLYSADYISQVKQLYERKSVDNVLSPEELAHRDNLTILPYGQNMADNPVKDVIFNTTLGLIRHIPNMAKDPNLDQKIAKQLDYVPYNFSTDTQSRLLPPVDRTDLKAARERLFKVVKCSIAALELEESNKKQDEIRNERFDYKPGEKDPDGRVVDYKLHADTACFFNSRIFAIKNSVQQEKFYKKQEELKATCSDPECYTPISVFHGCSRAAASNVTMRDGAFYMKGEYKKTAQALGWGGYFAYKAGKSARYVTDGKFSLFGTPGTPEGSNGCYLLCEVMRGANYSTNDAAQKYSSISAGVNIGWNDWEICIRNNDLICPQFIVDASCSKPGIGIFQDSEGNYTDKEGNILYDKNGRNPKMK